MADFVQALVAGDGASVGDALVRTKQNYYLAHTMDKFHAKTLAETVLYGLPMVHVHVAGDVQARLPASIVSASPMQSLVRQTTEEMRRTASYAVVRATYAFNVKGDAFQLTTTPDGQYYTYWGQPPYTESREWIQPKAVLALGEANLSGMIVEPHGAVFLGGTSHDVPFTPLAGRAGILGVPAPAALQPASLAANSEWYPPMRVDLHRLERADGAGTVLFGSSWAQLQFTLGQYDPHSATERLYDEVIVDEYFSNSPDYTSPTVESIDVQRTGATVTLMVQAGDASGISQVVVAYRGPGGTWWTIELVPDSAGGWTGTAAPAERYIVQVVDQGGNVAVEAVQGPQEQAVYFPFVKR